MSFNAALTYDLFITHAWRFHDDWNRIATLLDDVPGFRWRNFSVPWYDPAMDPKTAVGGRFISDWLETQILPCHVVVFLDGVYAERSARKWLDIELEVARVSGKPIIALPVLGAVGITETVSSMVQAIAPWDGPAIAEAIAEAVGSKKRCDSGHPGRSIASVVCGTTVS